MKNSITLLLVAASLLSNSVLSRGQSAPFGLAKGLDIQYSILGHLADSYVDTIDYDKMMVTGIDAMLETLDPYTVYIKEKEEEGFELMTTGNYGGIGALIRKKPDGPVVIFEPYDGSPAVENDLKPGDEIWEIDGKSVIGESSDSASGRMKGPAGTTVSFKVYDCRLKDTLTKTVTRRRIHLPSVEYSGIIRDSIGYVFVNSFTDKVSDEFRKAVLDLKSRGVKRLVIDLRDNGGGVMEEAVKMIGMFVPKGTQAVSSKGRHPRMNRIYLTDEEPLDTLTPILVMVNGNSASASEIFSGAMQDLGRGTLAGKRTFGKGLIQSVLPTPYNGKLKVTTGKYFTPSGRCVQKIGIEPDIDATMPSYSRPVIALVYAGIIGDWAVEYYKRNLSIAPTGEFHLSDEEYASFVEYACGREFDARNAVEVELDNIEKAAKADGLYDRFKEDIGTLRTGVTVDKRKMLIIKKDEIIPLLESDIITKYRYIGASHIIRLRTDVQLNESLDKWLQ